MATRTLSEIADLVRENNKSKVLSDAFLTCLIWKECGFRPRRNENGSSARGMMQLTTAAIKDVNLSLGHAPHFTLSDMSDDAKNIQCGTLYLDIRIRRQGGNVRAGVDAFGTGSGYSDNIVACEACMKKTAGVACLMQIHP